MIYSYSTSVSLISFIRKHLQIAAVNETNEMEIPREVVNFSDNQKDPINNQYYQHISGKEPILQRYYNVDLDCEIAQNLWPFEKDHSE